MSVQPGRGYLGISDVLAQLRPDFADISVSKIRFLETEGLITPARSPSGYRRFCAADVDRLRYILTAQRDQYLPLRVIGERLARLDQDAAAGAGMAGGVASAPAGGREAGGRDAAGRNGAGWEGPGRAGAGRGAGTGRAGTGRNGAPSSLAGPAGRAPAAGAWPGEANGRAGSPAAGRESGWPAEDRDRTGYGRAAVAGQSVAGQSAAGQSGAGQAAASSEQAAARQSGDDQLLTRRDLLEAAGISEALLTELDTFGLLRKVGRSYGPDALEVARTAVALTPYGVEARHLRAVRAAAERETTMIESLVAPIMRQRAKGAADLAARTAGELADLVLRLHGALVDGALAEAGLGGTGLAGAGSAGSERQATRGVEGASA